MNENLRKTHLGGWQTTWTKEEILAGLTYFKQLYGRFPTAHEIDSFEYLPSSRSIQRSYGGLVSLRKELLPTEHADFTIGIYRSQKAKLTTANGKELETKFYNDLIKNFQEISVHEHKVIRPGNVNCDFFIYLKENFGVVVDIFYAESIINLVNVVNIKIKRYKLVSQPTYLVVVGNDGIDNDLLRKKMLNKRVPLPVNLRVVTEKVFFNKVVPYLRSKSQYAQ